MKHTLKLTTNDQVDEMLLRGDHGDIFQIVDRALTLYCWMIEEQAADRTLISVEDEFLRVLRSLHIQPSETEKYHITIPRL